MIFYITISEPIIIIYEVELWREFSHLKIYSGMLMGIFWNRRQFIEAWEHYNVMIIS